MLKSLKTKLALAVTAIFTAVCLLAATAFDGWSCGNLGKNMPHEDLYYDVVSPKDVISPEDIFISVKTSGKFHDTRVNLTLKTWWNGMKKQTYFFTDIDDQRLIDVTGGHVVNTRCGNTHRKYDLCCKMAQEYDFFFNSGKIWWCHFDDDNYINPSMLVDALREYDWRKAHYIGRPSRGEVQKNYKRRKVILSFATGGAGICITRHMGELMSPWMRNGKFVKTCKDLNEPDDVTFGFVVTHRVGINLTHRNDFNSHLQEMRKIPAERLFRQVVLSYRLEKTYQNVVNLSEETSPFPFEDDESRLLSYHCLKYPSTEWCP